LIVIFTQTSWDSAISEVTINFTWYCFKVDVKKTE
jgi:hypothetical protein